MEEFTSHPIVNEFAKHYKSTDQFKCLQAILILGIISLQGKVYSLDELSKLSFHVKRKKSSSELFSSKSPSFQRSRSHKKLKDGNSMITHKNSKKKMHGIKTSARNNLFTRKRKNSVVSKSKNSWNMKLYGESNKMRTHFLCGVESQYRNESDEYFSPELKKHTYRNSENTHPATVVQINKKILKGTKTNIITYRQIEQISLNNEDSSRQEGKINN